MQYEGYTQKCVIKQKCVKFWLTFKEKSFGFKSGTISLPPDIYMLP